jgi:hypothetical protein
MKILSEIINWLEKLLGVTSVIKGFNYNKITVGYIRGNTTATITVSFDDITVIEQSIINSVVKIIEQHEKVATIAVVGNDIVITVNI